MKLAYVKRATFMAVLSIYKRSASADAVVTLARKGLNDFTYWEVGGTLVGYSWPHATLPRRQYAVVTP